MKKRTQLTLIVTLLLIVLAAFPVIAAAESGAETTQGAVEAMSPPAAEGRLVSELPAREAEHAETAELLSELENPGDTLVFTSTSECNPGTCEGQCCLAYEECVAGGTFPLTCMKTRIACTVACAQGCV